MIIALSEGIIVATTQEMDYIAHNRRVAPRIYVP
jgi:hypothetical protein